MMQGTIQTIHAKHGFGFIRDPEGAKVFIPPPCADPAGPLCHPGSRDAGGVRAGVGSQRAPHRDDHHHTSGDASGPVV
jgi:hypothetical protein